MSDGDVDLDLGDVDHDCEVIISNLENDLEASQDQLADAVSDYSSLEEEIEILRESHDELIEKYNNLLSVVTKIQSLSYDAI